MTKNTNEVIISQGYNSLSREYSSKLDYSSHTVIIDGVDVSECIFYKPFEKHTCWVAIAKNNYNCNDSPNCQFKQLQRLKKENEELKEFKAQILKPIVFPMPEQKVINKTELYKKCLEEIKEIIKNHEKYDILTFPDVSLKENAKRIIAQCNTAYVEILQKINEVLDV